MKKLTAGIFTVLMGLVSVNAADAAVASKGYVDKVVGENTTKITTLTGTVETNKQAADATAQALTDHKSAYETKVAALEAADTALSDRITTNADAIDELMGTGTGGDGSGTFGKLTTDVSDLKTTVGDANSGLVKKVGSLETLVGNTAVATQISEALTAKVGAETVATQINTAINSLRENEIKENADAIDALTGTDGTVTKNTANIATLQTLVGDTSVESQINTKITALDLTNTYEAKGAAEAAQQAAEAKVTALADGQVKTNKEAIEAINAEGTGILAQAKADATTKASTAETNAVAGAKTYTDAKVNGLNLQDIARIPAACSDTKNYCTLTTNGSQFVWEVIARDEETETPEQPSTTPGSNRLIVSPVAIVTPGA